MSCVDPPTQNNLHQKGSGCIGADVPNIGCAAWNEVLMKFVADAIQRSEHDGRPELHGAIRPGVPPVHAQRHKERQAGIEPRMNQLVLTHERRLEPNGIGC